MTETLGDRIRANRARKAAHANNQHIQQLNNQVEELHKRIDDLIAKNKLKP